MTTMPADQVTRRQRFEANHPDVEIKTPPAGSPWWKAFRDGVQLAVEHDLRRLLDTLESKLARGADQ